MFRRRSKPVRFFVLAILLLQALAVVARLGLAQNAGAFARPDPVMVEQTPPGGEMGLIGRADKLDLSVSERLFVHVSPPLAVELAFEGRACGASSLHRIHLSGSPHGATLQAERVRLQI